MLDYLKGENYINKKEVEPKTKVDIANNVRLSVDAIRNLDIDTIPDRELYQMCLQNCSKILSNIASYPDIMKRLLLNDKFIINLSQALYSLELTEDEKIQLCNTIYVMKLKSSEINSGTLILLANMVKIINKSTMPKIIDIGFSENLSGDIMLARYSSGNAMKQVRRINRVFLNTGEEISINAIAKVYESLGYLSHFTDLFEGIIYDKMDTTSFTQEQKETYGAINVALIEIMEQIPFNMCYTLLRNFIDTRGMRSQYDIRFNLNSCNIEDYPRINTVIDTLNKEGRTVPS